MAGGKRESLWNSKCSTHVSPAEYEQQVLAWFRKLGRNLTNFRADHLRSIEGSAGEYEFDIAAQFSAFDGARISVLAECKCYRSSVKRDVIMVLEAKLRDVGAHKGLVFSTSGFQKGAIKYASVRGIATICFVAGKTTYITKGSNAPSEPPPWIDLPRFAGWMLCHEEDGIRREIVTDDHLEPICKWLDS